MEVAYFYVKNYLGLEDKGYNFHGEYDFSFDIEKGILSCNKMGKEVPKNFFGKNIMSVNAVVGENGVGKTRVLKFLYEYLNKGIRGMKLNGLSHKFNNWLDIKNNFEYIIIYMKNGFFYINSNIFKEEKKLTCDTYYYSNIFDYDAGVFYREYMGNNFKNLSIGEEVFKKATEDDFFNLNKIKEENDIKQINFIRELENNKNGKFYIALKKEILIPDNIVFKFSYIDNESLLTENLKENLSMLYKKISKNKAWGNYCEVLDYLKTCIIIKLLVLMGKKKISDIEAEKNKKKYEKILYEIEQVISLDISFNNNYIKFDDGKMEIILNINILDSIKIIELCKKIEKEERRRVLEKNKMAGLKLLKNMNKNILNYNWNVSLSSGEKAMLRLFSNLHESLKNIENFPIEINFERKTIVLLIDELDATFHPEWQRKSLNLLLIYLENYLEFINEHIKIQLIISSHSPFLVADLPKENILVLDKNGIQKSRSELKAFGSNILDIYIKEMFLESTFGEFSKNKIKEVVQLLSKVDGKYRELLKEREKEIKFVINAIGEPLIKKKLEIMYGEYKKEKDKNLTDEEKLEKQLANIGITKEEAMEILSGNKR